MRAIYSLKITCDGDSDGKDDNPGMGFYVDDIVTTNPPVLLWCESRLASSGVATVDGALATAYAPLITELSELEQACEPDSPVVNSSNITITLGNHDKIIEFLRDYSIEILGLNARLSLNIFTSAGALTSSTLELDGKIEGLNYTDTTFTIVVSANKFARNGQMLAPGEQLAIGVKDSYNTYLSTVRNTGFKTVYADNGQDSFMLIGGYDTISTTVKKRTYQVFFKTSLFTNIYNLVGWWMYVDSSSTESKGEYRKITAVTEKTNIQVRNDIADPAIGSYITDYNDGCYLEIEIEGAYTEGLVVDLCTYVQFVFFDHSFTLSKNPLTGTVEGLHNIVDNRAVNFGVHGYACTLNTDGTIDVSVDYPIDEDTIATYDAVQCYNVELIGDDTFGAGLEVNLREWVYELGDDGASGDPYKDLNGMYAPTGPFEPGIFSAGVSGAAGIFSNANNAVDGYLTDSSYAEYTRTFTAAGKILVGIQFDLPLINDDFIFKSAHIGLAIKSTCTKGLATPTGIACITKQAYGTAVKHFSMPLDSSGGPVFINTIPRFYLHGDIGSDYFYTTDWQWKTPDTTPQTRFTCLESTKLNGIDTVEKYRKILKVGLFFLRDAGTIITDDIKLFEIAVIFKHENSLTEVYV